MVAVPEGIDPEPLARIRQAGGDELAARIVQLFLEHAPQRLSVAREAVATGDAQTLEQITHSLKSSAAQVGAERLAGFCRDLEERARRSDLAGAESVVGKAEEALTEYSRWAQTR